VPRIRKDLRPKIPEDVRSIARQYTLMSINVLAGIARSKGAPPAARAYCASTLLDRGWGRAPQQHVVEGDADIRVTIRQIIVNADENDMKVIEQLAPCDK
jgi:hypothetical protein